MKFSLPLIVDIKNTFLSHRVLIPPICVKNTMVRNTSANIVGQGAEVCPFARPIHVIGASQHENPFKL